MKQFPSNLPILGKKPKKPDYAKIFLEARNGAVPVAIGIMKRYAQENGKDCLKDEEHRVTLRAILSEIAKGPAAAFAAAASTTNNPVLRYGWGYTTEEGRHSVACYYSEDEELTKKLDATINEHLAEQGAEGGGNNDQAEDNK